MACVYLTLPLHMWPMVATIPIPHHTATHHSLSQDHFYLFSLLPDLEILDHDPIVARKWNKNVFLIDTMMTDICFIDCEINQ